MNRWLQTKAYTCARCGEKLLHDRMYLHALFVCLTHNQPRLHDVVERLDEDADTSQQHVDLARRLHRLWNVRVRSYLTGLAMAAAWQAHIRDLRRGVTATGYEAGQFYFASCLSLVEALDVRGPLSMCSEAARVAGFITDEEAEQLARGEAIALDLDPRPPDMEQGPPIVGMML